MTKALNNFMSSVVTLAGLALGLGGVWWAHSNGYTVADGWKYISEAPALAAQATSETTTPPTTAKPEPEIVKPINRAQAPTLANNVQLIGCTVKDQKRLKEWNDYLAKDKPTLSPEQYDRIRAEVCS